ncbi:MAG: response regulator transcription factor [Chloroflexi bacterium]|nr:response regulator transcription factor [Chloroflexota bacterium]
MNSPSLRILVVDDEYPIRHFLRLALSSTYVVLEAENGQEALRMVEINHPDLVILDLGLPDIDGLEVTCRLREQSLLPVIIVSVRDQEEIKVAALDAGADDYLTKPFSSAELLARIRATLRHCARPLNEPLYQNGGLLVDLALQRVFVQNQPIALTPTEYEILRALILHEGGVLTHSQLIQAVWGHNQNVGSHLLPTNISNLRKKIEQDTLRPQYIITEPGVGYRLRATPGTHEIEEQT